jgi:hypothetical protein
VGAYRYPEYYDIAFAVDEAGREIDFFAVAIREFSRPPVVAQIYHECITLDAPVTPKGRHIAILRRQ